MKKSSSPLNGICHSRCSAAAFWKKHMVTALNNCETHIWVRGPATKITHQEHSSSEGTDYFLVHETKMLTVSGNEGFHYFA